MDPKDVAEALKIIGHGDATKEELAPMSNAELHESKCKDGEAHRIFISVCGDTHPQFCSKCGAYCNEYPPDMDWDNF